MSGILLPDYPEYQRLLALARPSTADERDAWRAVKRHYAEQHKRIQYGVETFEEFVARVRPRFREIPKHLKPLYSLINRSRHEQVFAIVSMPPRHAKSTTFHMGLAYRCYYDRACQNAYATYTNDLSKEAGNAVRAICVGLGAPIGKSTETDAVKGSSGAVLDWKLPQGGGLKSTSVGGGITGRGIDGLLIIDDPIKGIEKAMSMGERDRVWRWLRWDILSRMQGGGSVIIIMTRWHPDDPVGRILNGGPDWVKGLGREWEVINLPAVGDEFGNPVDEIEHPDLAQPLWSSIDDRHPNDVAAAMEWYRIQRLSVGEFGWASLYQGMPRAQGQMVFAIDPATFTLPRELAAKKAFMVGKRALIVLDPAAKKTTKSDHNALSCCVMDGFGDRVVTVEDEQGRKHDIVNPNPSVMRVFEMWKRRCAVPDAIDEAKRWQKRYNLWVGIESDGTSANLPDWVARTDPGMKIVPIHTHGKDKFTRAIPAGKAWNDNRILMPAFDEEVGALVDVGWDVADAIRVIKAFTGHDDPEDDLTDSLVHNWNRLYRPFQSLPSHLRTY